MQCKLPAVILLCSMSCIQRVAVHSIHQNRHCGPQNMLWPPGHLRYAMVHAVGARLLRPPPAPTPPPNHPHTHTHCAAEERCCLQPMLAASARAPCAAVGHSYPWLAGCHRRSCCMQARLCIKHGVCQSIARLWWGSELAGNLLHPQGVPRIPKSACCLEQAMQFSLALNWPESGSGSHLATCGQDLRSWGCPAPVHRSCIVLQRCMRLLMQPSPTTSKNLPKYSM
jgi:hypothetical protein